MAYCRRLINILKASTGAFYIKVMRFASLGQPDTELFLRAVPFYTLLVRVVGGKKKIVGEGGRGGRLVSLQ